MDQWYCASSQGVPGSLRVTTEGPVPRLQWVASDGAGRIDVPLEPSHPVDVFVARRAGSVKMKFVAAGDGGHATHDLDFHSPAGVVALLAALAAGTRSPRALFPPSPQ